MKKANHSYKTRDIKVKNAPKFGAFFLFNIDQKFASNPARLVAYTSNFFPDSNSPLNFAPETVQLLSGAQAGFWISLKLYQNELDCYANTAKLW